MAEDLNDLLNQCDAHLQEARRLLKERGSLRDTAVFAELLVVVARAIKAVQEEKPSISDSHPEGGGEPEGGAQGNAPVGASPKPPKPLVGAGAARTFEEAAEPPRNP